MIQRYNYDFETNSHHLLQNHWKLIVHEHSKPTWKQCHTRTWSKTLPVPASQFWPTILRDRYSESPLLHLTLMLTLSHIQWKQTFGNSGPVTASCPTFSVDCIVLSSVINRLRMSLKVAQLFRTHLQMRKHIKYLWGSFMQPLHLSWISWPEKFCHRIKNVGGDKFGTGAAT